MPLSVLAITTSPRRHGNTESALDTVLESFSGMSVEKVVLNDLNIAPCKGCGKCEKTGVCIHQDDFAELGEKIRACDLLVFASPVYSMSVCAQAKILIDRCQVFWSRKYVLHDLPKPEGKKFAMFISASGQTRKGIFDHTVPVAQFLFDVSQIPASRIRYLLLPGLDKISDFRKNPEMIAKAKEAGDAMAALMVEE
ncbi:NADPH-dependent FMN reductase [Methanocorpusculum labreanum Z]|uniref:NADPH-dependent FMN reductase n=1 Tax=Methanocorpusculum labreanum (strain ATCC 43576 / DSM 4855 / Z) TaxID=410358 RepID=A2SU32_METLZ|nr:flavodoxin family protein [Methanocorpusculum labreanum]ABN07838.1 NADPH-dependent FMN reductase [Methanocorpusculum labreanum Z]